MTQIPELWQNPSWFLREIDVNAATRQQVFHFQHTTRDALASAPFLDERFFNPQPRPGNASPDTASNISLALPDLPAPPRSPASPECGGFIFHTAFCCSTLLASVLDQPGKVLALKEPGVLMTLANLLRTSSKEQPGTFPAGSQAPHSVPLEQVNQLCFQLLNRCFSAGEKVLLKPTNAANNLLEPALRSGARVLLLYSDLTSFLISVIKKGEACRYFVRHLLNILRLDRPDIDAWPERQRMLLTDLQVAALVWSMQIDHFENCLQSAPPDQIRSLKAETFLSRTGATLHALNNFFHCGYRDVDIERLKDSPRFQQHSKFSDQDYDSNVRLAERSQVEAQHADAIAATLDWARRLRENHLPGSLSCALLSES